MPRNATGTYHVLSRCARRAFLLGDENAHRKDWVADMAADLLQCFAIDLHAYAIMCNHIHLVLRPRPDLVDAMSTKNLVKRGLRQFPVRIGNGVDVLPVTKDLVARRSQSEDAVKQYRERLSSITWFMKLLKQRIARMANKEDACTGHFWESRFLTVPLLDKGAVYSCMAYVDRNPWRAGAAESITKTRYCSAPHRMSGDMKGLSDAEKSLNRHLTPMSKCAPVEVWTNELSQSGITPEEYRIFLDPSNHYSDIMSIHRKLGIDGASWQEKSALPGLFQGVAVGRESARRAFAATQGKKTIADKSSIWADR